MYNAAIFTPNCVYRTDDGRYLEYLSTSGKKAGEPAGFRFIDIANGGAPFIMPLETASANFSHLATGHP